MDELDAANRMSALGNRTRLAIFRLLVRAGEHGVPIGRIGRDLDIPLSTLAHHLDRLVRASLVSQRRDGRQVLCVANFSALRSLTLYLTDKCCEGLPEEISQKSINQLESRELQET